MSVINPVIRRHVLHIIINKNTVMDRTVGVVGVVVALLIVAGIVFYTGGGGTVEAPLNNATSTGGVVVTPTPPVVVAPARKAGVPSVATLSNTIPSDSSAAVTGTVNPNGAATSYWYEYATASDFRGSSSSFRQSVGSGYVTIPAAGYLTGLSRDTTYWFRLVAENAYGKVIGAPLSFRTTLTNPPFTGSAPVPRTAAATGITRTSANLHGDVVPNGATTQFWFEYGASADLGNATALASIGDGTAKTPVSLSVSGLNPLTTYWFRLNAQNQFGTVNGSIMTFKTSGPAAQGAPTVTTTNVTDIASRTASVHGTVNPNGTDTAYWFEYGTDSVLGSVLTRSTERKQVGAGTTAFTVGAGLSGLSPKTTYYYRLAAQNAQGITYGARKSFKTAN